MYMYDIEGIYLVVYRITTINCVRTKFKESRHVNVRLQISHFHGLKTLFFQYYSNHRNI